MFNKESIRKWLGTGNIELVGVTLLFIFKGQYQTYDVLNLAMANLSIICQVCAENNKHGAQ